jgi:hypothetical protein
MQHRIAQTILEDPQQVVTVCSCGSRLVAANRDDQADHAHDLGYLTVWAMNAEHDVFHARLTWALGLVESPTLMRLVHGWTDQASNELVALEEAFVLAGQRFLNAARKEGRT